MEPMLIAITDLNLGDGSEERAEVGAGFLVEQHQAHTDEEVLAAAKGAHGLLVQHASISARVLKGLPALRAVVRYGVGVDNVDLDAARRLGVRVVNVDDYCIDEVADHAAASVYAHSRRLVLASRRYAEVGWGTAGVEQSRLPAEDPVGIVGFGRIGSAVGTRLRAFGFPVLIWDPFAQVVPDWALRVETLIDLAEASRHLTLHVPLTSETRGLIGRDVLSALGPGGHLVNTARGGLVDEQALLAALDGGVIDFASLDVLATEPPTVVSQDLAAHGSVLVTPHMAYLSTGSLVMLKRRAARTLADLLADPSPGAEAGGSTRLADGPLAKTPTPTWS